MGSDAKVLSKPINVLLCSKKPRDAEESYSSDFAVRQESHGPKWLSSV